MRLLHFEDPTLRHLHVGTSEEANTDADVSRFLSRETHYLCRFAEVLETDNADMFAKAELAGKVNVVFILADHGLEKSHLGLGDDGESLYALFVATFGRVHHIRIDIGDSPHIFNLCAGDLYEYHSRYQNFFHLFASAIAPKAGLHTCRDICFDGHIGYVLAHFFLRPWRHIRHIPNTLIINPFYLTKCKLAYASGAVNDMRWRFLCRFVWVNNRVNNLSGVGLGWRMLWACLRMEHDVYVTDYVTGANRLPMPMQVLAV